MIVHSFNEAQMKRNMWRTLVLAGAAALIGCALIGQMLKPTIIEGQQFAHYIEFQSRFRIPNVEVAFPIVFDQYTFRISRSSANILLVAACTYPVLRGYHSEPTPRVCSLNAFAIDTEHDFAAREATADEWSQAAPLGEKEMNDPVRRTLKQELAKPLFLRAMPIDPSFGRGAQYEGYKYRGKEYRRRGDGIVSLAFVNSDDGDLVVLSGVDNQSLPKNGFLGDRLNGGGSGLVTLDVFGGDPSRRIAAIDVNARINVNNARTRISLVNSRWLALGLDRHLQRMLLFDFKPASGN